MCSAFIWFVHEIDASHLLSSIVVSIVVTFVHHHCIIMPIDAKPVVYDAMHFFNWGIAFLREHSWVIFCALLALYVARDQGSYVCEGFND